MHLIFGGQNISKHILSKDWVHTCLFCNDQRQRSWLEKATTSLIFIVRRVNITRVKSDFVFVDIQGIISFELFVHGSSRRWPSLVICSFNSSRGLQKKKKRKKRCTKKYTMWNYFYKCIILITYYVFDLTSSRLLTKNNRSKPKTKSQDLKCGWNSTIAAGVNEIKNDIKSAADSVSSVKRRSSLFVQDNSIRAIEAENFFSPSRIVRPAGIIVTVWKLWNFTLTTFWQKV